MRPRSIGALRRRRALDRRLVGNRGSRRVEQRIEDAGEADTGLEEAPLDERTLLVGIEVTELLVADLVDSCPHRHRLLDSFEDARALPGPELGLGRVIDHLGELRERELLRLDDLLVPDRVQVGALAEPGHLDGVAAAIVAPPDVQRLVHVAHEMNEETQRLDLLARLRARVLQHPGEAPDRLHDVAAGALRRRLVALVVLKADEVPGHGLVPGRIGADLVRPGGGLDEALRTEDGGHPPRRRLGEMALRDAPHHPVAGRSPGEPGTRRQREQERQSSNAAGLQWNLLGSPLTMLDRFRSLPGCITAVWLSGDQLFAQHLGRRPARPGWLLRVSRRGYAG